MLEYSSAFVDVFLFHLYRVNCTKWSYKWKQSKFQPFRSHWFSTSRICRNWPIFSFLNFQYSTWSWLSVPNCDTFSHYQLVANLKRNVSLFRDIYLNRAHHHIFITVVTVNTLMTLDEKREHAILPLHSLLEDGESYGLWLQIWNSFEHHLHRRSFIYKSFPFHICNIFHYVCRQSQYKA